MSTVVTAAEAALATAMEPLIAEWLKDGTTGGLNITPGPYPLTTIPQTILDIAKIIFMAQVRAAGETTLGPLLPSYTVAQLAISPLPAGNTGRMVYVSNESGGAVPAFSDGAAWRRVTDRAVIS